MSTLEEWEARGAYQQIAGHRIWTLDVPATREAGKDPMLLLHGFPTCSFDWRQVLDAFRRDRRVVALDFLGFGLSAKPDQRYSLRGHADIVEGVAQHLGLQSVALVTHDMGDSVGGELLARGLDGTLGFGVSQRVLTNGSIYIDMAQLSAGQQLLLSLDDAKLDESLGQLLNAEGFRGGVGATFSPKTDPDPDELDLQWQFAARQDGHQLLPRTIRYIEDRRAEERRYTGAIEAHPSPIGVVWGEDDPIAIVAMTEQFVKARPGTPVTVLDNVGHYPMIESPQRFADAVLAYL
ncbi:MAG TPA: alpha/beta hydrolase [Acidimicrobiia bacterium]|nr:alpha/beta hydrolase [Acidimicrobiia bacterium]